MATKSSTQRAFGVVRVSRTGDDAKSPAEQRKRLTLACKHNDLHLVEVGEELDVSGGSALSRRKSLLRAVELVEAGRIDVIIVAYFDRLVRSLKVQEEIVTRVERAGGKIHTVDFGEVSHASALKRLTSTMIGAINEYYRLSVGERTEEHKAEAVARGVAPFPKIPAGLRRGKDSVLEVDPVQAPIVKRAFEMRAATPAATINEIRLHLRANGIVLTERGVQRLLASRLLKGELHFGKYINTDIPRVVTPSLWRRVQETVIPRGRRSPSNRLLARQGILRCGTCNRKMVIGWSQRGERYRLYRCPTGDCSRRAYITADRIEAIVIAAAEERYQFQGRASVGTKVKESAKRIKAAEAALDAAVEAFEGIAVKSAKEKLARLQADLDDATDAHEELLAIAGPVETFTLPANRDDVRPDEWLRLIHLTISAVLVMPGRLEIDEKVRIVGRETETLP